MPTIYAAVTDGAVMNRYQSGTWAACRDDSDGTHAFHSTAQSNQAAWAYHSSGRGGDLWSVGRSFFAFDTSGVTATVSSATLKIRGYSAGTGDIIAVKATKPDLSTDIATADFDAITGFSSGNSMAGNVTDYSSEVTTWSTSGYNDITLNAQALSDMVSGGVLAICIVNYDHDYLNSAPSETSVAAGMYFSEYSSTSRDPYIDYTLATGPEVATVSGVAEASISTVSGVANASIAKILGVDMP